MLKSVIRTDEETKEYLIRLKRRLEEQRKAPVEGMAEFFAARINVQAFRSVMSQLPPYMREGLKKYVKIGENDKSKDISVNMKFSEPQEIGAIREKLNTSAGHVSVAQKYARFYAERQVRD